MKCRLMSDEQSTLRVIFSGFERAHQGPSSGLWALSKVILASLLVLAKGDRARAMCDIEHAILISMQERGQEMNALGYIYRRIEGI